MSYIETSAKDNINLKNAIEQLSAEVLASNAVGVKTKEGNSKIGDSRPIKKPCC